MIKDNKTKDYKSIIQEHVAKNSFKRKVFNNFMTVLLFVFVIIAIIPLASILFEVFKNGVGALSFEFLFSPPGAFGSGDGGIGPAIQGTLIACRTCLFNWSSCWSSGRGVSIRIFYL